MTLRIKVASAAKRRYGVADVKRFLKEEYWEKGMSTDLIASRFKKKSGKRYSRDAVRTLMKDEGIPLKAPRGGKYFDVQLRKNGFANATVFFEQHETLTKAEMARKLDVHFSTLCRHYDIWMADKLA